MDNLFAKYLEPHKESIDEGLKDAVIAAGQGIKAAAIKTKKAFKNVIDIKNKESFIDKVISTPKGGSFSSDTEKESDKIIFDRTYKKNRRRRILCFLYKPKLTCININT